jgi:hypothetical protein
MYNLIYKSAIKIKKLNCNAIQIWQLIVDVWANDYDINKKGQ